MRLHPPTGKLRLARATPYFKSIAPHPPRSLLILHAKANALSQR
jgi:hypothetical protein